MHFFGSYIHILVSLKLYLNFFSILLTIKLICTLFCILFIIDISLLIPKIQLCGYFHAEEDSQVRNILLPQALFYLDYLDQFKKFYFFWIAQVFINNSHENTVLVSRNVVLIEQHTSSPPSFSFFVNNIECFGN